jgi:tetratricopeptide (TPR) repeat protein
MRNRLLTRLATGLTTGLLATLPIAFSITPTGLLAQTPQANPFWERFGDAPVAIEQSSNGATQTLNFIDFQNGMLIAQLDGGVGEISLPVSETMVRTLSLNTDYLPRARRLIDQEQYARALDILRPEVYPLIKFHPVPEAFTQLHAPLRLLINTLVDAGELAEAEDIVNRIDLDAVDLQYSQAAIRLMNALFIDGQPEAGARIASALPVEGAYAANIRSIVDAADTLRAKGEVQAVIPLYREIQSVVSGTALINVKMWLAYCLVLDGQMDEADRIIEELDEPAPSDRLFSLYKLLEGSRAHSSGRYGEALDLLTRGFVRAQTSYDWIPELLFLIGDCYARVDSPTAARNVWTEIVTLFPDSPWANRAERSLAELPTS